MKKQQSASDRQMRGITMIALGALTFILSGCQTIPERPSEDATLLVVPVERLQDRAVVEVFGHYEVEIVHDHDESFISRWVIIDGDRRFLTVRNLPAGTYRMGRVRFEYESGRRGSIRELNRRFTVYPGSLTIAPVEFTTEVFYPDPGSRRAWMRVFWRTVTAQRYEEIVAELSVEENFATWRLAGLQ